MSTGFAFRQKIQGGATDSARAGNLSSRCLSFGVFQLDLAQQQLFKDGLQVKVQGKVYQALAALVETPGEIVTRDALRARLWPQDTHLNYEANVNTTVNKLRQVLGDTNDESRFIETIPRKGYSFVAKVECVNRPSALSGEMTAEGGEKSTLWSSLADAKFLRSRPLRIWFTASMLALVIAAILFGAAVTLYSHRAMQHELGSHPSAPDENKTNQP
jgi:DNA-binding winged helix-turn-helix (wHTH) protein